MMKKLFRMTLFKKIFLTIFVGLFIVETINVYFDYESICRNIAGNYVNTVIANDLDNIEKYFEEEGQNSSSEEIVQYVQNVLKDYAGYYAIMDNTYNILYEEAKFPNFTEDPYMLMLPVSCFEENFCDGTIKTFMSLKNIPQESLDKLENYIQKNPGDQSCIVEYIGDRKWSKNEITGEEYDYVEPTFIQVDNEVIFGERPYDIATHKIYMYVSHDLIYRDYTTSEDGYAYCINREELLKSSRKAAVQLYDEYGGIGRTRIGYEKQDNDLMVSQSIYIRTADEEFSVSFVNYYAKAFSDAIDDAIQQNVKIYVLTLFFSAFMSLLISYMITRRIKKIDASTREIADNHFDIKLKEKPHDELGTLSHSINEMSSKLKITMDKLNEEIENVKKLESLRKEFIANFTHEIKTPLGIINGYIELVETVQDENKKNMYLQAIYQETNHINKLVLAMLDLSRIESGKVDLKIEEIDLEDLISSTIDAFASLLEKKNIKIALSGETSVVKADRNQMEIVLKNFISNAIKHTPVGKHIYIHYNEKMFSIENEGSCIDEAKMKTIWETYVSSDREGSGLGLAICKGILDLHGFKYNVINTHKGVCFEVNMTDKD